jgi:CelD/BcsL family acetyltransferase involved in cellulose biosynthesis
LKDAGRGGGAGLQAAAISVSIAPAGDLERLGERWMALESACPAGFFLSWTFLGCLVAERYPRLLLLSVTLDGADVALALLGWRGRRAFLNETGIPSNDAVFIEHNGLLARPGHEEVAAAALRAVLHRFPALRMSGVGDTMLASARSAGTVQTHVTRFAPAVDLASLDRPYLQTLSSNARSQIRRATRCYAGQPRVQRAESCDEAAAWFASLVLLHQASWQRRGRPGAFADASTRRFHEKLIVRGFASGQVDVLRVASGADVVGYLYCFIGDARVLSYQSGFAPSADPRAKPGLVCHALAVEFYANRGMTAYDMLGGADRYKLTLGRAGETLHWITLRPRWSWAGLAAMASEKGSAFLRKSRNKLLPVSASASPEKLGPDS